MTWEAVLPVSGPSLDFAPYIKKMADDREAWLLEVFGSEENVRRFGHLYELHEEPMVWSADGDMVRGTMKMWLEPFKGVQ